MYNRRRFIRNTLQAGLVISISPKVLQALSFVKQKVKISLITDLHQDVMHDGEKRINAFIRHIKKTKPDAILQMGDFAVPAEKNRGVINLFNKAHRLRMHVIGNHDTDGGLTREQCIQEWGMSSRYYTQVVHGICFVVLDTNDKGSPKYKSGYPSFIGKEQVDWLVSILSETKLPVVIISHHPLAGASTIDNAAEIQNILSAHADKILIALNGHTHIDAAFAVGGINYVHINSASYFWVGGKYVHDSYPKAILERHPSIASTCPYQEALFSTLTIDPHQNTITIGGNASSWVGPSPQELDYEPIKKLPENIKVVPAISDRTFRK